MPTPKRHVPQLPLSSAHQPAEPIPVATSTIRATCTCLSTGLLDGRGNFVCATCRSPLVALVASTPRPFSQHDGQRPAGCGRVLYLREHRTLMRNADPEAWAEGRARLMTPAAWARAMRKHRPAPEAPASAARAVDADEGILADLGLTRRSAS